MAAAAHQLKAKKKHRNRREAKAAKHGEAWRITGGTWRKPSAKYSASETCRESQPKMAAAIENETIRQP